MSASPFGVYVHVPFCGTRCDYCAFVTYTDRDHLQEAYVDALLVELDQVRSIEGVPAATSVFFGGGTPSRLESVQLARVLDALDLAEGCEVSVEVNPEDATEERLGALAAAGVTRLSLGIQSTSPRVLAELGRVHRGDGVAELAVRVAGCGVTSWSADLIVGSRAERDVDLLASLDALLGSGAAPPHLSCYLLSVERGTPLSRDLSRHPDEDTLAARYELVDEVLGDHGYEWYEVSNWSLPGHECRHNQLYWNQGDYLGLGVAAHGHRAGRRRWNLASIETYLSRLEAGESVVAGEELVEGTTAVFERLALSLRTRRGVPLGSIEGAEELDEFLVRHGESLVLTRRGRLMADELIRRLVVG